MMNLTFADYFFVIVPIPYTIATLILSIIEVVIILDATVFRRKTVFKSSFYQIFAVDTVCRIIQPICYFLNFRMNYTPMFQTFFRSLAGTYNFWTQLVPFLLYYCTFACQWINLVLTFNRFTVFLMKYRYTKFWRRNTSWFTFFAMAIPLAPTLPLWTERFSIYLDEYGGVSWDHQVRPAWSNSNSAMLMFVLTGVPSLTLNLWMCAKLIGSSPNLIKTTRADKRLWMLTLYMFIFTFVHTSIQFLFNIDGVSDYYFEIMHVQVVLFDITTLLPSWIILWTSPSLRRQVLSIMSFYKVQMTESEDTHSNVQSITNQNFGNMLF